MEEVIREEVKKVLSKCYLPPQKIYLCHRSVLSRPAILLEDEVEFANATDKVMNELGWELHEVDDSNGRPTYIYKLKPAPL